jgi:hypothetical protein
MSRITTALVNLREQFAYNQLSQTPPATVAAIQTALKDPAGSLGGKTMASKRLYEIRAAVQAGTPWVEKVNKHEGKVAKTEAPSEVETQGVTGEVGSPGVVGVQVEDKDAANVPDTIVDCDASEVPELTSESSEVPDMFKD